MFKKKEMINLISFPFISKKRIKEQKIYQSHTLLGFEWLADNVFAHVILLGQIEQLADLVGSLGATNSRHNTVGQAFDLGLTFLDDD